MYLVERHIIKNKELDEICFLSKNLYNYCNFILRQLYFKKIDKIKEFESIIKTFNIKDKEYLTIDINDLLSYFVKINQKDFRSLPAQSAQQIIMIVYQNWKNFYKSIKSYYNNSKKFINKPNIPKYKNKEGKNVVIYTNQQCCVRKNGVIKIPKKEIFIKTKVKDFKEIRIVPNTSCCVIEIIYEKQINKMNLNKNFYLSVDLGVNNLTTCINNTGNFPFIVNGKIIKSTNQYYNKKRSYLQSKLPKNRYSSNRISKLTLKRNNKVQDYFHKISRFIINYCVENDIGNIVIGYNSGWKQKINIGKVNNQNFMNISFKNLIEKIKYKSELVGINFILIEENYTSKCDALALESIEKHNKYLGKRIKRGLFKSSIGKLVNADVNGSLNILRKVIGDSFVREIINRGLVLRPLKLNIS